MSSEVENKTFSLNCKKSNYVHLTDTKSIIVLLKLYLFFCFCLCASRNNVIRCIFNFNNVTCLAPERSE